MKKKLKKGRTETEMAEDMRAAIEKEVGGSWVGYEFVVGL